MGLRCRRPVAGALVKRRRPRRGAVLSEQLRGLEKAAEVGQDVGPVEIELTDLPFETVVSVASPSGTEALRLAFPGSQSVLDFPRFGKTLGGTADRPSD